MNQLSAHSAEQELKEIEEELGQLENHTNPVDFIWPGDISLDEVEPDDLVEGFIAPNTLCCFFAPPGIGKTFIVLDMAAHIAKGAKWHGREVEQGAVLYIGLEGDAGVRRRLKALKKEGIIDDETPLIASPSLLNINSQENIENWINQVKEELNFKGQTIKLVIIDTLMRAMSGGDFNSGTDMSSAVTRCMELIEGLGCTVLIVHHCGKDAAKKELGHTSFRAALDSSISLSKDGDLIKVKGSKQKDMADGSEQDMHFKLKPVHIGHTVSGKDITSCVIEIVRDPKEDERIKYGQEIGHIKEQMLNNLDDAGPLLTGAWDSLNRDRLLLPKNKVEKYRKELLENGEVEAVPNPNGNGTMWYVCNDSFRST